jgi:hypothetical protein
MAESRSSSLRWVAFGGALVLALLGAASLVWSISQHQDARDDLAAARAELATRRANTSSDAEALQHALDTVGTVREQLGALGQGVVGVADLDQRDLDAVRAAVQAGLAAKLTDYNAAVDQRAALDPQHDAALEQLRQQANAVITALDALR